MFACVKLKNPKCSRATKPMKIGWVTEHHRRVKTRGEYGWRVLFYFHSHPIEEEKKSVCPSDRHHHPITDTVLFFLLHTGSVQANINNDVNKSVNKRYVQSGCRFKDCFWNWTNYTHFSRLSAGHKVMNVTTGTSITTRISVHTHTYIHHISQRMLASRTWTPLLSPSRVSVLIVAHYKKKLLLWTGAPICCLPTHLPAWFTL